MLSSRQMAVPAGHDGTSARDDGLRNGRPREFQTLIRISEHNSHQELDSFLFQKQFDCVEAATNAVELIAKAAACPDQYSMLGYS